MNDFLSTLVARVDGHPNSVYPRPVSRYESSTVSNKLTPDQVELFENVRTEETESARFHNEVFRETISLNSNIDHISEVSSLPSQSQIAENISYASRGEQIHADVDSLPVEPSISLISLTNRDQAQILPLTDKGLSHPKSDATSYPLVGNFVDNSERLTTLERRVDGLVPQQDNPSSAAITPTESRQQANVDYSQGDLRLTSEIIKQKPVQSQLTSENSILPVYPDVSVEQVIQNMPTAPNNIRQPVIKVTIGRIDVRAIVNAPTSSQLPIIEKERHPANQPLSLSDYLQQRAKGTL